MDRLDVLSKKNIYIYIFVNYGEHSGSNLAGPI